MGKWLEATVVEIHQDDGDEFKKGVQRAIKVHFKGFTPKWDEVIDLESEVGIKRVMEVGALSGSHGWARYDQGFQSELNLHIDDIKRFAMEFKQKMKQSSSRTTVSSGTTGVNSSNVTANEDADHEEELRKYRAREKKFREDLQTKRNF